MEEDRQLLYLKNNIIPLPPQSKSRRYEKYAFDIKLRDIAEEEENINNELFQKCFTFTKPSLMLKVFKNEDDKEKQNDFVNVTKSGLIDLKDTTKMTENEKRIEQPDRVIAFVEEILEFNRQIQEGQGLKILTPDQMLSRLPISLVQLKAGNNSEKLKNEIRQ